jgi:SAM-dependent MidA family methyltransferase
MGSSPPSALEPVSAVFAAAFHRRRGAAAGLRFDDFIDVALYDAAVGYYRRPADRVGYGPGTDFYTAATSGPVFGELIAAAAADLLGGRAPADYTFVEIGAERPGGILEGVRHPFGGARTVRLGDKRELSGACVVFSNELFDAQPFRRWVFRRGSWREIGVRLEDGRLEEIDWGPADYPGLPADAAEGYTIDAPLAAAALAADIAAQPWHGVFIACDYGKSWREITEEQPGGTGRAYFRHEQSNDLFAHPGDQDLTCHVCWDWLAAALTQNGFTTGPVHSQESFFVHHAAAYLAALTAAEAGRFSARKQSLTQLLLPAHLGLKFQALTGLRG